MVRRTRSKRTRSRRDKGGGGASLPSRSQSNPIQQVKPKVNQTIKPGKAKIRIDGKVYVEHTGAYNKKEAQIKAADIRKRGYNARVVKTGEGFTVYAAKPEIKPGDKVSAQAPSHWFDPHKKHTNTVKKDEKGLYIEVQKGKLYLEDSAHVTLARKKKGDA